MMNPLDNMSPQELRNYLDFLLWHYRVADAFWFLFTSEQYGQQAAEELNMRVWQKAGELAARDLVKRFNVTEKGLDGFIKAQSLYPWAIIIGYQFERTKDEIYLTVPSCPSQMARLRRGLGEYNCKEMHKREFEAFAKVVDERICVECVFAPTDKHPDNTFCKWRFYIE